MKAIVAHHEISGPAHSLEAIRAARIEDAATKTLGTLIGQLFGSYVVTDGNGGEERDDELPQDVLEGTRRSRFAPPIARRSNKPGTPPAAPAIVPDAQAPTGGAADGAAGDEGAGA